MLKFVFSSEVCVMRGAALAHLGVRFCLRQKPDRAFCAVDFQQLPVSDSPCGACDPHDRRNPILPCRHRCVAEDASGFDYDGARDGEQRRPRRHCSSRDEDVAFLSSSAWLRLIITRAGPRATPAEALVPDNVVAWCDGNRLCPKNRMFGLCPDGGAPMKGGGVILDQHALSPIRRPASAFILEPLPPIADRISSR